MIHMWFAGIYTLVVVFTTITTIWKPGLWNVGVDGRFRLAIFEEAINCALFSNS